MIFCYLSRIKKGVFRVTGLKILGGVGTHIFFNYLFSGKKIMILCIFKGISPFKMLKIIFFFENLKKFLGFTNTFRQGRVTQNSGIFGLITYASSHSLTLKAPPTICSRQQLQIFRLFHK